MHRRWLQPCQPKLVRPFNKRAFIGYDRETALDHLQKVNKPPAHDFADGRIGSFDDEFVLRPFAAVSERTYDPAASAIGGPRHPSHCSDKSGRARFAGPCRWLTPPRCADVLRKLSGYHRAIQAWVEARPDGTIAELRAWLLETHQVSASATLVWETLVLLNLTLKSDHARR